MNTSALRRLPGCLSLLLFAAVAGADPMDCRAVTVYSTGEASMKAPFGVICPVSGGVKEGFLPLSMAAKVSEVTLLIQAAGQSGWSPVRIPVGGPQGIDLKCITSKESYEAAGCDTTRKILAAPNGPFKAAQVQFGSARLKVDPSVTLVKSPTCLPETDGCAATHVNPVASAKDGTPAAPSCYWEGWRQILACPGCAASAGAPAHRICTGRANCLIHGKQTVRVLACDAEKYCNADSAEILSADGCAGIGRGAGSPDPSFQVAEDGSLPGPVASPTPTPTPSPSASSLILPNVPPQPLAPVVQPPTPLPAVALNCKGGGTAANGSCTCGSGPVYSSAEMMQGLGCLRSKSNLSGSGCVWIKLPGTKDLVNCLDSASDSTVVKASGQWVQTRIGSPSGSSGISYDIPQEIQRDFDRERRDRDQPWKWSNVDQRRAGRVKDPIELGNPNSAPAIQRAIEEMTAFTLGVPKTLDGSGYSAQSGAKVDLLKGSYVHGQKGGPSSAPSDEFCRVVTSRCKATCDALIGPLQAKRDQNGSLPSARDCKSGCERAVVPAGCPDLNH